MKEVIVKFLASAFLLLLIFSVVTVPFFGVEKVVAQEGGSWITRASLPMRQPMYQSDVVYTGTAMLGGKIYYIDVNMTLRYDPETNNWTELAPLPIKNHWGTLVAYQNKIYVIGGNSETPTQVYDPATDTWENRTAIPSARNLLQANVVDGKIYVISGDLPGFIGTINPSSSNDVYDPETDSWSQMAPIPVPVVGYASVVLYGKIYIMSGVYGGGVDYSLSNLVQIFDPATNHWTNGTSIPVAVFSAGACVTNGMSTQKLICVLGGQTDFYWYSPLPAHGLNQVYDLETDTWTNATAMPTPRSDMGVAVINDEIYAIGGNDGSIYLTVNEKYSIADSIPEFPSWIIFPLFLVVTSFAIFIKKTALGQSS